MLNEREARALDDIEQRLRTSDPAFARRMTARPFPAVSVLCVAVFLALPFVALLRGPRAALVTADVAAIVVTVILIRRQMRKT